MSGQSTSPVAGLSLDEKRRLLADLLRRNAGGGDSTHPLSHGQQALWFLHRRDPRSHSYHVGFALRVRSEVDVAAFRGTFEEIVRRHPALRTSFPLRDGEPVQQVRADAGLDFAQVDARQWDADALAAAVDAAYRAPFDLEDGPLLRLRLFTAGPAEHVLVLVIYHIVFDGWSARVLMDELGAIYPALRAGRPSPLPPPARQYGDFVDAQARLLAGEAGERLRAYWHETLRPPLPDLPPFRGSRRADAMRGETVSFAVGDDVLRALRDPRRVDGATPYMVMLAAWVALLHRCTGRDELLVCLPTGGRGHPDWAAVIGYFINPVVLRARAAGELTFRALAAQVRTRVLEGMEHQEYPFPLLARELRAVDPAGADRLTRAAFNYQKLQGGDGLLSLTAPGRAGVRVQVGGLALEPYRVLHQEGQFDLLLEIGEDAEHCFGHLKYNAEAMEAETARALCDRYLALLADALDDPDRPLAALRTHAISTPLPEAVPEPVAPLSYHQERLWFIDRFETGTVYETSPIYHNLPLLLDLRGPVHAIELAASLGDLAARHAALRTRLVRRGDTPVQQVDEAAEVPLDVVDADGWTPERVLDEAIVRAARPFALEGDRLVRAALVRGGRDRALLLLTLHHAVADRHTLRLLAADLGALYTARVAGGEAPPPTPALRPADFARRDRELSASAVDELLFYWEYALAGPLPALELPADRPRPAVHTFTAARHAAWLGPEAADEVRGLARAMEVDELAVFLAAFFLVLHRHSGQGDLVAGTAVREAAADGVAGPLANLLAVRAAVDPAEPVRDVVRRVAATLQGARAHAALPFDRLVRALAPVPDMSRTALFDVVLEVDGAAPAPVFGEAVAVVRETNLGHGKYDLHLLLARGEDGITCHLTYNADLYDAWRMERLASHFAAALRGMAARPDAAVGEVEMLTVAEREEQLVAWCPPLAEYPRDRTIVDRFAEQAGLHPGRVALTDGDGMLTYGELHARSDALAATLVARGVPAGSLVGLYLERSAELVVAILAVLKAGCGYLPLEPGWPRPRLAFILGDAAPPLVLTHAALAADLPAGVEILALDGAAADPVPQAAPRVRRPDDVAYCIYTSGSTGQPKGVLVEDRNVVSLLAHRGLPFRFGPDDVWTLFHSCSYDFAVWELFGALLHGGRVVVVPADVARDPAAFHRLLVRERVTVLNQTPGYFALLARVMVEDADGEPPPLRYVIFGGEALRPARLAAWREKHPTVTLVNMYGITETTVHVTYRELTDEDIRDDSASIGRPLPTLHVYLLDDGGRLLPVGAVGEIHVGGAGVARGYLNRPELARFVPDPFAGGDARMYRSGDLGRYLPNGEIEYLGRRDAQIKVRGYRVEPGEVEHALRAHPGVRDVAVVARGEQLVAYVVAAEGAAGPGVDELLRIARAALPEHMVPAAFVRVEALPLTPNGKVDVRALPDPGAERPELRVDYVPPHGEAEEVIGAAWREMLGIDRVGVHDNLFDLGAHSLLVARVHERLRGVFGERLTIVDMFRFPTVHQLAAHLSAGRNGNGRAPSDSNDAPAATGAGRAAGAAPVSAPGGYEPIAIVGMACRYPGADSPAALWETLEQGRECVTFFSDEELRAAGVAPERMADPRYIRASAVLDDVESFDAPFFGYSAREAELIDPQQRIFLECAWTALEHAGYPAGTAPGDVGVFAGAGMNTYLLNNVATGLDLSASAETYLAMLGNEKDFLPSRVAYKLNLTGPSVNVQTACSTSLVAIHQACRSLQAGECGMALAGGVSVRTPHRAGYLYEEGMILSPDGHCRAFDARAQGTVGGNGAGIVVLKRLRDALADGDTVHAVVRGSAVSNDGSLKIGFTAPGVRGQSSAIREAMAAAGVTPADISYVETHGTGTVVGDPLEIQALTEAYGGREGTAAVIPIGSVKTNLGHTDTAAGVAGVIKTALALGHEQLPPSLNFEEPNPRIDFAGSPFRVATRLEPWPRGEIPRRAGVSSFGLGGTNAHAVLEEAPAPETAPSERAWHLLAWSARTPAALEAATDNLLEHLRRNPDASLADVAYTLHVGRARFPHRRALLCTSVADAVHVLESRDPERLLGRVDEQRDRPVAFLFSGHGGHHVGMARELYETEPVFRDALDRTATLLEPRLGLDIRDALFPAEETEEARERLGRISVSQPAIFAVEHALATLILSWGVRPAAVLGHSSGEYVAACVAGVLSLEDALSLVVARGTLMQGMPRGTMLAVAAPERDLLPFVDGDVSLAAVNGPADCVLAGPPEPLEALQATLVARGLDCRVLRIPVAGHSGMMDAILPAFVEATRHIRPSPPRIPYLSNLTGDWITGAQAADPEYWGRHLRRTVRFAEGLETLIRTPELALVEIGPGGVLSTLARKHPLAARGRVVLPTLRHPQAPISRTAYVPTTLAKLWLAGVSIDGAGLYPGERRRRIPLPTYPFERQRYWIEPGVRATSTTPADRKPDVADWFHVPVWKQSAGPAAALRAGQLHCLVFLDDWGMGEALCARLRQAGHAVATVRASAGDVMSAEDGAFTIDPADPQAYDRLVAALRRSAFPLDTVVHLWGMDDAPFARQGVRAALERGFYSVTALARALVSAGAQDEITLAVVSNHLHDVTGDEPLRPDKATVLGPCRVIGQECPNLRLVAIDPGALAADDAARLLFDDVTRDRRDPVIAYRGRRRWVQAFEPVRLEARDEAVPFRRHGVYLVTGGLGGIGLDLAEHLAERYEARLVLTGRTVPREGGPADGTDARKLARIRRMEEAGASVWAVRADVADEARMREVLDEAERRFGPLHGVVHAAGHVRQDLHRTIHDLDRAQCEGQLRAKVDGTLVLASLLEGRGVEFCLMLSSLASVLGGLGFTAYAAANAFMDAWAGHATGTRWTSASWDGWLSEDRARETSALGVELRRLAMSPAEGVEAVRRILAQPPGAHVLVTTGDLQARLDRWVTRAGAAGGDGGAGDDAPEPRTAHARPELSNEYVAPGTDLERTVAGIWAQVLGLDRVGRFDNFFELGGTSLIGVQVVTRLNKALGTNVSVARLFERPTVSATATVVAEALGGSPEPEESAPLADRRSRGAMRRERAARLARSVAPGGDL